MVRAGEVFDVGGQPVQRRIVMPGTGSGVDVIYALAGIFDNRILSVGYVRVISRTSRQQIGAYAAVEVIVACTAIEMIVLYGPVESIVAATAANGDAIEASECEHRLSCAPVSVVDRVLNAVLPIHPAISEGVP
jgi:hypothetical protein